MHGALGTGRKFNSLPSVLNAKGFGGSSKPQKLLEMRREPQEHGVWRMGTRPESEENLLFESGITFLGGQR